MKKPQIIILFIKVLLVAIIVVGVVVGVVYSINSTVSIDKTDRQGAVASNSLECPGMAADIFKKGLHY